MKIYKIQCKQTNLFLSGFLYPLRNGVTVCVAKKDKKGKMLYTLSSLQRNLKKLVDDVNNWTVVTYKLSEQSRKTAYNCLSDTDKIKLLLKLKK